MGVKNPLTRGEKLNYTDIINDGDNIIERSSRLRSEDSVPAHLASTTQLST